jgi:branched-subunit amino acid transport protein
MTALLVIVAIGLGTYALRVSMFVLLGARSLPAGVGDALGFVGPAAVAALVATMMFTHSGSIEPRPTPELVAIAAGYLTVRRTGNAGFAFVAGLPTLWVLTAMMG